MASSRSGGSGEAAGLEGRGRYSVGAYYTVYTVYTVRTWHRHNPRGDQRGHTLHAIGAGRMLMRSKLTCRRKDASEADGGARWPSLCGPAEGVVQHWKYLQSLSAMSCPVWAQYVRRRALAGIGSQARYGHGMGI